MIIRGIISVSDQAGNSASGGLSISFRFDRPFPWRRFRCRAVYQSRLAQGPSVAFAYFASVFLTGAQREIFIGREHHRPHWGARILRIIQKCHLWRAHPDPCMVTAYEFDFRLPPTSEMPANLLLRAMAWSSESLCCQVW